MSSDIGVSQSQLNHNRLHESCLTIFYHDMTYWFKALLIKGNSAPTLSRNIQALAIEIFLVYKGISEIMMREVSPLGETLKYNLRHQHDLLKRPIKRVYYGMESLGYRITKK